MTADRLFTPERVRIHPGSATRDEAMREATDLLVAAGAVTPAYYEAMQERERSVSTFMGNGLAIPHGTFEARHTVIGAALSFVRYDGGVDWGGHQVTFVVGIAGIGGEPLELLSQIALIFADATHVERLRTAVTSEELFDLVVAGGADGFSRR